MATLPARADDPLVRHWNRFVDGVTMVWLVVFLLVLLHSDHPVLDLLSPLWVARLDRVLLWMTLLFIADLGLQYRWSGLAPAAFLRRRWFDVLMAIPFLRPLRALRLFRIGRIARVFRAVSRGRNVTSLYRKGKRTMRSFFGREREADPALDRRSAAGRVAQATPSSSDGASASSHAVPAIHDEP